MLLKIRTSFHLFEKTDHKKVNHRATLVNFMINMVLLTYKFVLLQQFFSKNINLEFMTEKIQTLMRDNAVARWTALVLLASTMFFAYMFVDVLSPLQSMLQEQLKWTPDIYGTFASSEYFLNVFAFFLIF